MLPAGQPVAPRRLRPHSRCVRTTCAQPSVAPDPQNQSRVTRRCIATTAALLALSGPPLWGRSTSASALVEGQQPPAAEVAKVQEAYDSYAASYDGLDNGNLADTFGFPQLRAELLSKAAGQVLEVAVGTGLNLQYYDFSNVEALTAVDISEGMLRQARERVQRQLPDKPITFKQGNAMALSLPDASFNTVVDTFSLCVIPDPGAALREMARVVRPSGRVLLLEHTKSDNPLLASYQDLTASTVAATSKGCFWNQNLPVLLRQAGLVPLRFTRYTAGTIAMIEAVRA